MPFLLDMVVALKRIALNYGYMGITVKSLEYQLKALHLLETYDNKQQEASIYLNIGNLYNKEGDKTKAEEYYLKAAGLYKNNLRGEYYTYTNLGVLYENRGRYEESMKWLRKAEAMLPTLNNDQSNTGYTFNLANTVTHMGKPREGIALFKKAMTGYRKQENDYGIATCYRQMAEALSMLGEYKRSEIYSLKAVDMGKQYNYPDVVQQAYWDLQKTYVALGQFKAYEYQKSYLEIYDSLSGQQRRSKLGLLEKEFELSNIESEKQRLEKENEVQKVQARSDKITRIALGSSLGLFVLASAIAAMAYYRTRS